MLVDSLTYNSRGVLGRYSCRECGGLMYWKRLAELGAEDVRMVNSPVMVSVLSIDIDTLVRERC